MISNSFHSSVKSHSISSAASLAKVERHNSRGYFSLYYDKDKISDLVGSASSLAADIEAAINDTFTKNVEEYNERQKRKDRKIDASAFEYFCSQKNLDIASEAIFQMGDQKFWSKYRTDKSVNKNGKRYILKSYPERVKRVMDDIFKKQVYAYENIYETHGEVIAAKINDAYNTSNALAQECEREYPVFKEIFKMELPQRTEALNKLDPQTQTRFVAYFDARNTMATIAKLKLRERCENHQMHIKVVGATSHYDEWSPHAHGVSICYADGYTNGLSSRVAKSVVLNRWALEVIQERLHEIAEHEMEQHPEIFRGEDLKPTEKGRNYDYTTEQIRQRNLNALESRIEAAEALERTTRAKAYEAQETAQKAMQKANTTMQEINQAKRHLMNLKGAIKSMEEYNFTADELQGSLSDTEDLIKDARELVNCASMFERKKAAEIFERFAARVRDQLEKMKAVLTRLFGFEEVVQMPIKQRRAPSLEERIKAAAEQVKDDNRQTRGTIGGANAGDQHPGDGR